MVVQKTQTGVRQRNIVAKVGHWKTKSRSCCSYATFSTTGSSVYMVWSVGQVLSDEHV